MKAYKYLIELKDKASAKISAIAKSAGLADKSVAGLNNKFTIANTKSRMLAGSTNLLKTAFLTLSTAMVGIGVFGLITNVVKLGAEAESTRIQFQTLTGSVQKGNKLFDDLNNMANTTPFNNRELQKNANTLLAFGVANEKIIPTLSMIGDVAGGNKEKLGSLSLAFGQVQSMGKLMGQDLNQMINAGFNPLQEISKKTGISMAVLKDKMSKGQISAQMVEQAFMSVTSKGGMFYQMMEKMSKTLGGKWSTFIGKLQLQLANIGIALAPFLTQLLDIGIVAVEQLPALIETFSVLPEFISQNVDVIGLLGIAYLGLNAGMLITKGQMMYHVLMAKAHVLWTGLMTVAQWNLNAAFWANPIGITIAAIALLTAGIVLAYRKFDWFRGIVHGVWETMKVFGSIIKDYVINRFKELLTGITGIGSALLKFFKGDWKGAWDTGKQAIEDLMGVGSVKKAVEDGKKLGGAYKKGYAIGLKKKAKNRSDLKPKTATEVAGNETINQDDLVSSTDLSKGLSGVTGGGSKQTNITVNLGKFMDNFNINTSNIQEGVQQTEEMMMQMLLRVLNSTNQMQTN